MATLELNGKSLATQTSTAEPVIASTVTGAPALALTNATGTMPTGTQDNITRLGTVTVGNLSNTAIVYPAGHVLQTIQETKNDENSATYTANAWDKVKDAGGNAEWKGTINDVGASNYVLIHMSFVAYQYNGDGTDGGAWAIYREASRIYGHTGGNSEYFGSMSSNINWYRTTNLIWIDKTPATGTNNYYLGQTKYGSGGMVVKSASSEFPFICILQEIQV